MRGSGRYRGAVLVTAALAALSFVAVACSGGSTQPQGAAGPATTGPAGASDSPDRVVPGGTPKTGGQLAVGVAAETDSFNPYSGQWSVSAFTVANAMLEPLAALDDKGIAKPYLAESFLPTGDFTSWTITIRPGITFHNGTPLDAAAVKKNLDTGKSSGLTAQVFTVVDTIEAVDKNTVKVTMKRPWATFPATLAVQSGYMAAPEMLDDPNAKQGKTIGTGPFAESSRQRDATLIAKRNPNYWRKDATGTQLPYLDAVEFRILVDATSRKSALEAGDIDALEALTPDLLHAEIDAAKRGEVQLVTSFGKETDDTVLALNTSREPFDDPLARQALAYAIDQDKVSEAAYQSVFPGAWSMFEPGSPYYISKGEAGYPSPNLETARQLAQQYQAKHGKPLKFTVLIPPAQEYINIAQTVQAQVKDYGIDFDISTIEQTQLINKVIATGDYQASGFLMFSSPTPDQSYIFLATKPNPNGLSLNYSRFDDQPLTAAMDEFRAAGDPKARVAAVAKVQKELAKNLQVVFLVHNRAGLAFSNQIHGVTATTFPGTDVPAASRYPTSPFYAFAWKG